MDPRWRSRQVLYFALAWAALVERAPRINFLADVLLAALALYGWSRELQRGRALADTAVSPIASAAQGFVSLRGRLKPLGNIRLIAPSSGCACVWYRERVEELTDGKWRTIASTESQESLLLVDDSGECLIVWDEADILTPHKDVRTAGVNRTTVHWLGEGEQVTVLGELRTQGQADAPATINQQVGALLAEWKADHAALRARFDRDGDGEISSEEWEAARSAARREVLARLADPGQVYDTHLIVQPRDGRPFIVSALPARRTAWHFGWVGLLDLAVLFAAMAMLGLRLR